MINGVKGKIEINFVGSIEDLVKKLKKDLMLNDLEIDTDQDPPHEMFATCEVLGFNVWLHKSGSTNGNYFELEIATSNDVKEVFSGQIADISQWFAKHVSLVSNLECSILHSEARTRFKNGVQI